jgi:hypothetical protein
MANSFEKGCSGFGARGAARARAGYDVESENPPVGPRGDVWRDAFCGDCKIVEAWGELMILERIRKRNGGKEGIRKRGREKLRIEINAGKVREGIATLASEAGRKIKAVNGADESIAVAGVAGAERITIAVPVIVGPKSAGAGEKGIEVCGPAPGGMDIGESGQVGLLVNFEGVGYIGRIENKGGIK